jgi:hypothetical protein
MANLREIDEFERNARFPAFGSFVSGDERLNRPGVYSMRQKTM